MSEDWKKYAADFNAMTDDEVEMEANNARTTIEEQEDWLEAVAAWEAAGKPRAPSSAQAELEAQRTMTDATFELAPTEAIQ